MCGLDRSIEKQQQQKEAVHYLPLFIIYCIEVVAMSQCGWGECLPLYSLTSPISKLKIMMQLTTTTLNLLSADIEQRAPSDVSAT